TAITPRHQMLDTEIGDDERNQIIAEFQEKHGRAPVHVGSTKTTKTVHAIHRTLNKQEVKHAWALSCGPAGLVVVDADAKHNGPQKLAELYEQNGGVPEGVVRVRSQSGGHHDYYTNPDRVGCPKLQQMGCDIKGVGGYVLLPGMEVSKTKSYGTE
ncbi:bifunctional DNA primase/polymerase, partial [Bacillus cereus]|uniref:bifunctional DNA primase/polymerase n=2 Tax=Bacteria TaxID=2 RepID=UPI003600FEAC